MLPTHLRVLYLHGFASSPRSRKALFFSERMRSLGFKVEMPDLAGGNFTNLTITGQLRVIEEIAADQPVILIGSSLGGYLAGIYAARHREVDRLILLAPAFGFYQLWKAELGPERLRAWRENGAIPVFHYGVGREVPLGYQFFEDAAQYESAPDFPQPALILHGSSDPLVPLVSSIAFAETRANVRVITVPSGHELTDVLEDLWQYTLPFLTTPKVQIE